MIKGIDAAAILKISGEKGYQLYSYKHGMIEPGFEFKKDARAFMKKNGIREMKPPVWYSGAI